MIITKLRRFIYPQYMMCNRKLLEQTNLDSTLVLIRNPPYFGINIKGCRIKIGVKSRLACFTTIVWIIHIMVLFQQFRTLAVMADVESLEKDGFAFAKRAIQCDSEGLVDTAIFYYVVGHTILSFHPFKFHPQSKLYLFKLKQNIVNNGK
jgi:hypothetical protein